MVEFLGLNNYEDLTKIGLSIYTSLVNNLGGEFIQVSLSIVKQSGPQKGL